MDEPTKKLIAALLALQSVCDMLAQVLMDISRGCTDAIAEAQRSPDSPLHELDHPSERNKQ
jgi:hypothetical protein